MNDLISNNTHLPSTNAAIDLSQYAKQSLEAEKSTASGKFISCRAGILSIDSQPLPGNKMDVIILSTIHENSYYSGKYDPTKHKSPVCYAYSSVGGPTMAPHELVKVPQAELCSLCPHNVFGSADNGVGKACKNTRRIAMIAAPFATSEDILTAEVRYMRLPVTSAKGYSLYSKKIAALYNMPPFGIITTIAPKPDFKSQFLITFKEAELVSAEMIPSVIQRHNEQEHLITFPYMEVEPEQLISQPSKNSKY